MVPPLLNAKMPCLNTLCRGATRFSLIASFIAMARIFAICFVQTSRSKLKSNKHRIITTRALDLSLVNHGAAAGIHSIAKALETIATGLLSRAFVSVTRPKLMVRPSRTTRASASTSADATRA